MKEIFLPSLFFLTRFTNIDSGKPYTPFRGREMKKQKRPSSVRVSDKGYNTAERRNAVIKGTGEMIESYLQGYIEPQRAGTAKGDPVGLSKKKMRAACWMVLFPNCLSLSEIAKICGVSLGVLKVWRTEEAFMKAVREYSEHIGKMTKLFLVRYWMERALEKHIKDSAAITIGAVAFARKSAIEENAGLRDHLVKQGSKKIVIINDSEGRESKGILETFSDRDLFAYFAEFPHYNEIVNSIIVETFKEFENFPGVPFDILQLLTIGHFWDKDNPKRRKEWTLQTIELQKATLINAIEFISDPNTRKEFGDKAVDEMVKNMKENILELIDILTA